MEVTYTVVLLRLCVQFLALPVYLLWYVGVWDPLCKRVFPYFMVLFAADYNKNMAAQKKKLFSNLKDFFVDPLGELKLLETGTSTGSNFQFFPNSCRVICTDFHSHLQQCLPKDREDLIQVVDSSVDVVIFSLVLCFIVEGVLREVYRILRLLFFLEHIAFLTFKLVFDGCCITRKTCSDTRKINFSDLCCIFWPLKWIRSTTMWMLLSQFFLTVCG
uniref:Methyltransferase type 11 domain-containing protein n=1 Tax=Salvator merianae TaxID=96440 RepID=A0A8D0C5N7_SALMN